MKRIFFIILGLLTAVSGFSQANLQPAATVNLTKTEQITVGQLRIEVERMETAASEAEGAARRLTVPERRQVLDVMINEKLVLQAAERDRVTISENEVNQQIQQLRGALAQQVGRQPTDTEFAQAIRSESGLDVPTFREQLRKQMIVQKYLMSKKGDLINSIKIPTDAEILAEYNIRRSELVRPETIRVSMIMVPFGDGAAARTNAKALADRLKREIGSDPSKFDEVAQRSVTPNSGFQAGDAGYLPRNAEARQLLGQTFIDTAFSLRQGQVSNVIEGLQGFQIIKVTENYAIKQLELTDIMQLGTRITVRDYIGQFLLTQRQQTILTQASEELLKELRTNRSFQVFEDRLNW